MEIICFSSIDWDFNWQGHQEVMSGLAERGHRVLFVENTGVRVPRLGDLPRLATRLLNWSRSAGHPRQQRAGLDVGRDQLFDMLTQILLGQRRDTAHIDRRANIGGSDIGGVKAATVERDVFIGVREKRLELGPLVLLHVLSRKPLALLQLGEFGHDAATCEQLVYRVDDESTCELNHATYLCVI